MIRTTAPKPRRPRHSLLSVRSCCGGEADSVKWAATGRSDATDFRATSGALRSHTVTEIDDAVVTWMAGHEYCQSTQRLVGVERCGKLLRF